MSRQSPDLNKGITLAIFSLEGAMPLLKERVKMWVKGAEIEGPIFLRRCEERPLMSGVFLSSSFLMALRISSSVTGTSDMLKEGALGFVKCWSMTEISGWEGWICSAIFDAILVKKALKELAIEIGSVINELLWMIEVIVDVDLGLLIASLSIHQVFLRFLEFFSMALEKWSFLQDRIRVLYKFL